MAAVAPRRARSGAGRSGSGCARVVGRPPSSSFLATDERLIKREVELNLWNCCLDVYRTI